ncbi:MAG: hypothetical protein HAW65_04350 [Alphaproteobacteria bacterium]|nr:hypothetical protein [Alphaproteobacteria bacterium]MBE8220517.1 hypothetical protein [Alphaproteobacteria bacterium]
MQTAQIEHPIDLIESLASTREWSCERSGDDELNLCVVGKHSDYHLAVNWRIDLASLHVASVMDIRVPQSKRSEMCELLALINEQLWLGHFDSWSGDGTLLFRIPVLVSAEGLAPYQCTELIDHAVEACDRFFPAFQFVIWAGHTPQEALKSSLFETQGDA